MIDPYFDFAWLPSLADRSAGRTLRIRPWTSFSLSKLDAFSISSTDSTPTNAKLDEEKLLKRAASKNSNQRLGKDTEKGRR